jgi:hypothetical protein
MRFPFVVLVSASVAACATLRADSPAEEKVKVVTERANARWQAIIRKDFDAAYEYLSPTSRQTVTRAGFKAIASRLQYKGVEIKEVACEAATCKVKLELTYDVPMRAQVQGVRTPLDESWVIDNGQAWYVWLV